MLSQRFITSIAKRTRMATASLGCCPRLLLAPKTALLVGQRPTLGVHGFGGYRTSAIPAARPVAAFFGSSQQRFARRAVQVANAPVRDGDADDDMESYLGAMRRLDEDAGGDEDLDPSSQASSVGKKITPAMAQYLKMKEQVPGYLLFFQLGDFF